MRRMLGLAAAAGFMITSFVSAPSAQASCALNAGWCSRGNCTVNAGYCADGGRCTVNLGTCTDNGACTVNLRHCDNASLIDVLNR